MLRVEDLVKSFAGERRERDSNGDSTRVLAVDGVTFEVEEGQLFTLLGPSGCGKTTTLRSIAGLEHPDSGSIYVNDRLLFSRGHGSNVSVPANRRDLGMVFQSYAIWPHMRVFDNVAFPLQVRRRSERVSRREIRERVMRVLETMQLAELAERPATKLSGGQQQRLALARALVTEPALLLLDEPLSNLDAKLRESLRFELKRLQRELAVTCVYVTHDQIEALALSSVIAVMKEGRVLQVGRPREVYENPNCQFVAEFIGTSNFIGGKVVGMEGQQVAVDTSEGRILVDHDGAVSIGTDVVLSIRPEALEATLGSRPNAANEWKGTVRGRAFLGDSVDHIISVGKYDLRNRMNPSVSIAPDTDVFLYLDPAKLRLVPLGD